MAKKVVRLTEVLAKIKRREMKDFKQSLKESTEDMLANMESPVGFAIVIWNSKGDMDSFYDVGEGVIGVGMVPTLVHDKLNRQVAQDNLVTNMLDENLDS